MSGQDILKSKLARERERNQQLIKQNRDNKRKILEKLKQLEEEIKDIMYM